MMYRITRRRTQVQEIELEAHNAGVALSRAELNSMKFYSITNSSDEWSYEVSPIQ